MGETPKVNGRRTEAIAEALRRIGYAERGIGDETRREILGALYDVAYMYGRGRSLVPESSEPIREGEKGR